MHSRRKNIDNTQFTAVPEAQEVVLNNVKGCIASAKTEIIYYQDGLKHHREITDEKNRLLERHCYKTFGGGTESVEKFTYHENGELASEKLFVGGEEISYKTYELNQNKTDIVSSHLRRASQFLNKFFSLKNV